MGKIDLHIHSIYSDGSYTPQEVIQRARELNLKAVSITDHDSVKGIEGAMEEGKRLGVEVVPGVEMSADIGEDEIHILGYYLNWRQERFLANLNFFQEVRIERNKKLLRRLRDLGMEVKEDELERLAPKSVVSRLHVARSMVKKGYVESIDEAFEEWLNPGRPAYIERERFSPFKVINLILDTKGVPVFAHPFLSKRDDLIPKLVEAGLMGIEVYHSAQTLEIAEHYKRVAREYDLLITGGSDCHGENKEELLMGKVDVPEEVLWNLKEARRRIPEKVKTANSYFSH